MRGGSLSWSQQVLCFKTVSLISSLSSLAAHRFRWRLFKLDFWGVFSSILPSTSLCSFCQWCYQPQWSFSCKKVDFWHHFPTCLHPCQLPSNNASKHRCNAASAHHVSPFQTSVHRRRQLLVVYRLAFWQHNQPIEADFLTNMASTLSIPAFCSTSPLQTLSRHVRPMMLLRCRSWIEVNFFKCLCVCLSWIQCVCLSWIKKT